MLRFGLNVDVFEIVRELWIILQKTQCNQCTTCKRMPKMRRQASALKQWQELKNLLRKLARALGMSADAME